MMMMKVIVSRIYDSNCIMCILLLKCVSEYWYFCYNSLCITSKDDDSNLGEEDE